MLYGNGYDPDKASGNCVVHLDTTSAPRVLWCGEDIHEYKLPIGTRVIYAKPPIPGLLDRRSAIRRAIENPENMDPLPALLRPGMKLTIAIDDISIVVPADTLSPTLTLISFILSQKIGESTNFLNSSNFFELTFLLFLNFSRFSMSFIQHAITTTTAKIRMEWSSWE